MKNDMFLRNFSIYFLIVIISSFVRGQGEPEVPETGSYEWKPWPPLPKDAYKGSSDIGRILYIGKVRTDSGNIVGTINQLKKSAIIMLEKKRIFGIRSTNIKILCTQYPEKFYWESVDFGNNTMEWMRGAIKGGYQQDIDTNLYIGKVTYLGETKIGKVIPPLHHQAGLWVWDSRGNALKFAKFQILKVVQARGPIDPV